MKTLLTNGCSWTFGGGLDHKYSSEELKKITWPYHLSELLGADTFVNLAVGCGSNQRIVRTTLDWILAQDQETIDETIAVIQWTEISRFETYMKFTESAEKHSGWNFENIPYRWLRTKVGCVLGDPDPQGKFDIPDYLPDLLLQRYLSYSDIEGLYNHISHLLSLGKIFELFGIKYYYWNMCPPYSVVPEPLKRLILETSNWLEPRGIHSWQYDRVSQTDMHPNEQGHKQLAKHIYNAIIAKTA